MDAQQNDGSPPPQQQHSEGQNPLQPDTASEGYSPPSHPHGSSRQDSQEVDSVQSSWQSTGSPTQSNQLSQEQDDPSQPPNDPNSRHSYTQSPIRDHARVAVVIYDMLIRAGPQAEMLSAQLAQAYPAAAALARHYAMHASHLMPLFVQNPVRRRGSIVLRRVNVSSVAWFCSFIASILALLRLWMIFALALGAAIATSSDNSFMYQVVDHVVSIFIERGPKRQLYRWMLSLLNEGSLLVAAGNNGAIAGGIHTMMPNQAATALLITPVTSGILGFVAGMFAALCINSALRATGGIRVDSHED